MTEQQPSAAPEQHATPAAQTAPSTPPAPAEKQPPWGKPEDFNPEKAWELIQNLRNERKSPDPALKQELESLRSAQQQQQDAIAKAFGIKPEQVSDTDRLAKQVETMQQQIVASERRALAAEHKVPESLLTAADAEGMKAQALALVEFAQGAHVAAAAATPAFQPNPGQGQGNAPLSPEAQAAAEYEKYYPSTAS